MVLEHLYFWFYFCKWLFHVTENIQTVAKQYYWPKTSTNTSVYWFKPITEMTDKVPWVCYSSDCISILYFCCCQISYVSNNGCECLSGIVFSWWNQVTLNDLLKRSVKACHLEDIKQLFYWSLVIPLVLILLWLCLSNRQHHESGEGQCTSQKL